MIPNMIFIHIHISLSHLGREYRVLAGMTKRDCAEGAAQLYSMRHLRSIGRCGRGSEKGKNQLYVNASQGPSESCTGFSACGPPQM